jgi:hypothetical protein
LSRIAIRPSLICELKIKSFLSAFSFLFKFNDLFIKLFSLVEIVDLIIIIQFFIFLGVIFKYETFFVKDRKHFRLILYFACLYGLFLHEGIKFFTIFILAFAKILLQASLF